MAVSPRSKESPIRSKEINFLETIDRSTDQERKRPLNVLVSWAILDVAVKLCVFVKTHEYPQHLSEEFNILTQLFDELERELRADKIIPEGKWPITRE